MTIQKHLFLKVFVLGFLISCAPVSQNVSVSDEPEKVDLAHFYGDKIVLEKSQPRAIKNLRVDVHFMPNQKFLTEARPYVRLLSKDGHSIRTFYLEELPGIFAFNDTIEADIVYAELALYFCKEGDEGLCLIKNILFEIPLDAKAPAADLELSYKVPAI